jgi:hypothetical protein
MLRLLPWRIRLVAAHLLAHRPRRRIELLELALLRHRLALHGARIRIRGQQVTVKGLASALHAARACSRAAAAKAANTKALEQRLADEANARFLAETELTSLRAAAQLLVNRIKRLEGSHR